MFKAQFFLSEKILQFGYAATNIRQKIMTLRIISLVRINRKKYIWQGWQIEIYLE